MTSDRPLMANWIVEALKELGGSASTLNVAKRVWKNHGAEIQKAGDLFYTWQYDLRWAAKQLRDEKIMKATSTSDRSLWELGKGA